MRKSVFHAFEDLGLRWWQNPLLHFFVFAVLLITAVYFTISELILGKSFAILIVVLVMLVPLILFGTLLIINFNIIARSAKREREFLTLASHQLRTPISALRWMINIIEHRYHKDPARALDQRTLSEVHESVRAIANIVGSLLETSRIDARRLKLFALPIDLVNITQKTVDIYQFLAKEQHITIHVKIFGKIPLVLADEARIALVIQNLLENAIQYSPRGGEIVITIKQTNTQSVCWSIADQGLGVATNEQKNIFQKYYRAKNARDKRPGGTGIGLYVARGIVEHLGGKMYFISALGRGSTFSFTLPTHKKHKK